VRVQVEELDETKPTRRRAGSIVTPRLPPSCWCGVENVEFIAQVSGFGIKRLEFSLG
jgi:hypothetical protein